MEEVELLQGRPVACLRPLYEGAHVYVLVASLRARCFDAHPWVDARPERSSNSAAAEADAAFARIPLDVHDARERDRVPPVLGVDLHGAADAAVQRLLHLVGRARLNVGAHHLPAVEGDL